MAAPLTIGWFGEDVYDAVEDAATSAVDVAASAVRSLGDAAKVLGSVLKLAAPIVAMWPGIGTAVSVAFSAASAVALGTRLDDAVIGMASAAIPGGLPRIAFDSSVAISRDLLAGKNAFGSVVDGCRAAAGQAGGQRAVEAFDYGLALARGQNVSDETIRLGRAQLAATGQTEALAAFDAAVAVSKGEGADDVLFAVARDYIAANGGPLALASFDAGLALAHGQGLQDAGFAALQVFVNGNDSAARALVFVKKMVRAAKEGRPLLSVLVADLAAELAPFVGSIPMADVLRPIVDAIKLDPSALAWGSKALADAWGIAEPYVRAAQAVMRTGTEDAQTFTELTRTAFAQSAAGDAAGAAGVLRAQLAAQQAVATSTAQAANASTKAWQDSQRVAQRLAAERDARASAAIALVVPIGMKPPARPAGIVSTTATAPRSLGADAALGGGVVLGGAALLAVGWWALAS